MDPGKYGDAKQAESNSNGVGKDTGPTINGFPFHRKIKYSGLQTTTLN
jgi:hypothetical protein